MERAEEYMEEGIEELGDGSLMVGNTSSTPTSTKNPVAKTLNMTPLEEVTVEDESEMFTSNSRAKDLGMETTTTTLDCGDLKSIS